MLTAFAQLFAHSAVPPYIIKPIETPTSTYCVGNTLIKPTVHFTKIADGWRYSTSGIGGYTDFADTTKLQTTHNHRFIYYYAVTASNDTNYSDTVRLTVKPNVTEETSLEHCGTYIWGTQAYSSTGTYHATFTADNGCDSNVTLHLTVNDTPHTNFSDTACHSYIWNTVTYSQSGTYSQILKTSANCDSVVTLNLTINQSTTEDTFATACDKFTWHGNTYTQSGIYTITTTNTVRCDSTIILHLTINHSSESIDIQNVCDSLTWRNGLTYYANNTTDTVMLRNSNAQGCDSTITLNLVVRHSSSATDPHTACDQFTWINGLTYTADNTTDTYTLHNAQGCDSVVTLNLTINQSTTTDTFATACDQFTWHGNTYTENTNAPIYHDFTTHGCDSTVNLHLTIKKAQKADTSATACNSFIWRGRTFYASTIVSDTTHRTYADGCDSIVTLHLTVNQSSPITTDNLTACDSLTWINGQTYTASNTTAAHTLHNIYGCDSTIRLNLTIIHSPQAPTIAGPNDICLGQKATYTIENRNNNYTYKWYLDGEALDFDPTSEPITFDKQYEQVSAIASENNRPLTCWSDTSRLAIKVNTIQAPEVKDLIVKKGNGTPIIIYPTSQSDKYHYTWYKNNTEITNIPDRPYYVTQPNKDKQGDNFYVNISLPTQSQCQNNSNTIKLNITPKQADQALAISPNPSNGNFTVTLLDTNDQASTIQIYNNSGVVVAFKETNSNHNDFNLTLPQGNYLVQVATRSGNIYTQKLIIK